MRMNADFSDEKHGFINIQHLISRANMVTNHAPKYQLMYADSIPLIFTSHELQNVIRVFELLGYYSKSVSHIFVCHIII